MSSLATFCWNKCATKTYGEVSCINK